jgi:hypothetical protein
MTGLEPLVVGYLTAWALQKARRVGERADDTVDHVLDSAMDRLEATVLGKVGDQPAVLQLEREAVQGTVANPTARQAEHVIAVAAAHDETFARQLRTLVEEIRAAAPGPQQVVVNATASDQAKMPVLGTGTQHNCFG